MADPTEAWAFQIAPLPPSTQAAAGIATPEAAWHSAVWVAQRVPDEHFVPVANRYVTRDVTEGTPDEATPTLRAVRGEAFRYASHLWEVAEYLTLVHPLGSAGAKPFERLPPSRHGVRRDAQGRRLVDWLLTFGGNEEPEKAPYSNDRLWRTFSLWAPDREWPWPPHTPLATDIYPFSAAPARPLTAGDFLSLIRDVYRGAAHASLDLTRNLASGPYGDPSRYDGNQLSPGGTFPRAISMFRTSYSHVTEIGRPTSASDRPWLGGRVWATQGAPHAAVYTPLHILPDVAVDAATQLPHAFVQGSLHRSDVFETSGSYFWQTNLVNNWARANGYDFAWDDIEAAQAAAEGAAAAAAEVAEAAAASAPTAAEAAAILAAADRASALASTEAWRSLATTLMTKLHDGYLVASPLASPTLQVQKLFYPAWWLERVGYYHPGFYPCNGPCDGEPEGQEKEPDDQPHAKPHEANPNLNPKGHVAERRGTNRSSSGGQMGGSGLSGGGSGSFSSGTVSRSSRGVPALGWVIDTARLPAEVRAAAASRRDTSPDASPDAQAVASPAVAALPAALDKGPPLTHSGAPLLVVSPAASAAAAAAATGASAPAVAAPPSLLGALGSFGGVVVGFGIGVVVGAFAVRGASAVHAPGRISSPTAADDTVYHRMSM